MAKFFKSVLVPLKNDREALEIAFPHLVTRDNGKYFPTMEERLGNAECPQCPNEIKEWGLEKQEKHTRWMLLPPESASVTQGGKQYIECLDCGYKTHL
jgi:hypothetical protein